MSSMSLFLLLSVFGCSLSINDDCDCLPDVKHLMEEIKSLKQEVHSLKKRGINPGNPLVQIAFSAGLSAHIGDLGKSQPIVFDDVITNIGGRYNNKTGLFYCDSPGTYVFNIHILAMPNQWIQVELVRNGVNYAHVYAFDNDHYSTGSNSVILELEIGDFIWVRAEDVANGLRLDALFTTFSGFLLYPR